MQGAGGNSREDAKDKDGCPWQEGEACVLHLCGVLVLLHQLPHF